MKNEKDELNQGAAFEDTADTQTQIGSVRAELVEHVRVKKGLLSPANQFEVGTLVQLSDAPVIDDPLVEKECVVIKSAPFAADSPIQISEVRLQKMVAASIDDKDALKELQRAA